MTSPLQLYRSRSSYPLGQGHVKLLPETLQGWYWQPHSEIDGVCTQWFSELPFCRSISVHLNTLFKVRENVSHNDKDSTRDCYSEFETSAVILYFSKDLHRILPLFIILRFTGVLTSAYCTSYNNELTTKATIGPRGNHVTTPLLPSTQEQKPKIGPRVSAAILNH